jgi:hypothetical protein
MTVNRPITARMITTMTRMVQSMASLSVEEV